MMALAAVAAAHLLFSHPLCCLYSFYSVVMSSAQVSREVAGKYQELMQECQQLQSKVVELEIDRNEHRCAIM